MGAGHHYFCAPLRQAALRARGEWHPDAQRLGVAQSEWPFFELVAHPHRDAHRGARIARAALAEADHRPARGKSHAASICGARLFSDRGRSRWQDGRPMAPRDRSRSRAASAAAAPFGERPQGGVVSERGRAAPRAAHAVGVGARGRAARRGAPAEAGDGLEGGEGRARRELRMPSPTSGGIASGAGGFSSARADEARLGLSAAAREGLFGVGRGEGVCHWTAARGPADATDL
mmetsp:Transcript_36266/g.84737  ORF Transcript_36266/g.84737 Transcript_36266/m.84737 type:complete len:233 (+) Transcript_36266:827-1525(+)